MKDVSIKIQLHSDSYHGETGRKDPGSFEYKVSTQYLSRI